VGAPFAYLILLGGHKDDVPPQAAVCQVQNLGIHGARDADVEGRVLRQGVDIDGVKEGVHVEAIVVPLVVVLQHRLAAYARRKEEEEPRQGKPAEAPHPICTQEETGVFTLPAPSFSHMPMLTMLSRGKLAHHQQWQMNTLQQCKRDGSNAQDAQPPSASVIAKSFLYR
jgi:hypothetical protein